jgi:mannose-6-phosphate isomerase-like protein (cupin superfamily)
VTGWIGNIETSTLDNENFRTVLHTGTTMQLTVMRLQPGEEIGWEQHDHIDQFIRVEEGVAEVHTKSSGEDEPVVRRLEDDWATIIPAGTWHNVVNVGEGDLKLYSIYSPPEHPDGAVHHTKAEADAAEAQHHGG